MPSFKKLIRTFACYIEISKMKINKFSFEFEEFASIDELKTTDAELMVQAVEATKNAYAPYSLFRVGAALRLSSGKIITGSNQENVAYPSGLCAERVAFFYANSNYPDESIETVAITARAQDFQINEPVTPCGACRQVMSESESRQHEKIRVLLMGQNGKIFAINSVEDLLPLMFKAEGLKK
jgi:cytidine deaminase